MRKDVFAYYYNSLRLLKIRCGILLRSLGMFLLSGLNDSFLVACGRWVIIIFDIEDSLLHIIVMVWEPNTSDITECVVTRILIVE